jgi:NAD(P)-dependent dehydrogenase (short-subunit alcohol dehydrogenase family)
MNDRRVAIITGCESETGAAIVARFAREGYAVAGCCVHAQAGQAALAPLEKTGANLAVLEGDVRVAEDAERMVSEAATHFGRMDVLVNSGASRRIVGTIMDISDADFDEEMAADLKSAIYLSRAAVPIMARAGGGAIVNLSSILNNGGKGRALRSASKAALASLTRAMALDHADQKIRVNCVLVGPTLTRDIAGRTEQLQRLVEEAPLGELHTPDDVAAAVFFLASDDARHITGALLPLDAGRSLPAV